jgi:CarD family transcriptional regulator
MLMGHALGDTIVHPQHGTAVVTGVLQKDIGSGPTEYLELFIAHAGLTVMIPAEAVADVGLRAVSTRKQAEEVLAVLATEPDVHERWTDRNAVTVRRMKSGEIRELAMVVRDLIGHAERTGKALSSAEREARDRCIGVLARELALSLDLPEDEVRDRIIERGTTAARAGQPRAGEPRTV